MSKVFVDGFVYEAPEQAGQDIEDVVYGEDSNTVLADSTEEFQALSEEYVEAELLNQLPYNEGFQALLSKADREAQTASDIERSYDKLDEEKIKKLRLDRIKATAIANWIRQTVENAASVQKPVLRQK